MTKTVTIKDVIVIVCVLVAGVALGWFLSPKPSPDNSLKYQEAASKLKIENKELTERNDSLETEIVKRDSALIKKPQVVIRYAKIKTDVDKMGTDSLLRYIRSKVSGYVPDSTGN